MHNHALGPTGLCCFAMWSFLLACGPSADERCDDVLEQIDAALQSNIEKGVLLPTAVGCELTPESFDPRVQRHDREYLLRAFQNACARLDQGCPPTPSGPNPRPSLGISPWNPPPPDEPPPPHNVVPPAIGP